MGVVMGVIGCTHEGGISGISSTYCKIADERGNIGPAAPNVVKEYGGIRSDDGDVAIDREFPFCYKCQLRNFVLAGMNPSDVFVEALCSFVDVKTVVA